MTGSIKKFITLLLFFQSIILIGSAWAQNVSVRLEPSLGMASDSFMLSITVRNSDKLSPPSLKESKEFVVTSSGTTTQTQIFNGVANSEVSFNFELSPREGLPPGEYDSPSGVISVDGTATEIPSQKITIVETPPEQKKQKADIKINQFTDKEVAYVGEQITYTVQVISGQDFLGGNLQDIEVMGFWREKLGEQEKKVFQAGSKTITTFQEILIPNHSGDVEIPSRKLTAQILGPARKIGGLSTVFDNDPFFSNFLRPSPLLGRTQLTREFSTKPVKIEVKPLPPTKLKGYMPVGQLNMKFSFDRDSVKKGENINLKIRLSGFANLRPYEIQKPERIEDSFKVYIDPADTNVDYEKARVRFTKIFKIALVPTHSGELTIPEFKINFFDPLAGEYKVLSTTAKNITVEGNFDERSKVEQEEEATEENKETPETGALLSTSQDFSISKSLMLSIAVVLISIALSFVLYFKKKKISAKQADAAISTALRELDANSIDFSAVLKNFIGKKLNLNLSPLTLKEIQLKYIEKLNDENITKQGSAIINQLENALYNPQQEIPENFKSNFIEFIKILDGKL